MMLSETWAAFSVFIVSPLVSKSVASAVWIISMTNSPESPSDTISVMSWFASFREFCWAAQKNAANRITVDTPTKKHAANFLVIRPLFHHPSLFNIYGFFCLTSIYGTGRAHDAPSTGPIRAKIIYWTSATFPSWKMTFMSL